MKKILFALAALLPLLVSCGKEDKGNNNFVDPHFIQYAGKLIMNEYVPAASSLTKATGLSGILESIEFTESGLYVVGQLMDGELEFITGNYKVNGDTYDLEGFGTVKLTVTRASLTGVIIQYLSGLIETLTAEFLHATGTNVAYRGWTIDRTRVTINGFHTPASADFKGCNFEEMAKFLNDNGHKGSLLPPGSLKSVSITGTNSIIFAYSDGTADVAEYSFSGSTVNFSWQSGSRLLEVENGKATIDYLDGKCILKIEAALKGSTTSGVVTFVMSPMA